MTINSKINETLSLALKEAFPPWRRTIFLAGDKAGFPQNIAGVSYSVLNSLLLQHMANSRGFLSNIWGTKRQWQAVQCKIKKDEVGIELIRWDNCKTKPFTVFNAHQVFGSRAESFLPIIVESEKISYLSADRLIDATKAKINRVGNDFPCYDRTNDTIILPEKFANKSQEYASIFHELIHWSEWRTGWSGTVMAAELIAEISTCILETKLGLPHCEDFTNHNKYKDQWIEKINSDSRFLFEICRQANKSINYILSLNKSR